MRAPHRMSQESLFGFLTSTNLPVVSRLAAAIRWISLGLTIASLLFALVCLVAGKDSFWSAHLPWSGALPALASGPIFALAWWNWRAHRMQAAATSLFAALFTLTILANWPRGGFSPAWYLHPVLSLLAAICLGVIPGLSLTLVAVTAMLSAAVFSPGENVPEAVLPDLWVHATSLAAVCLASALAGAIVNRLLFATLVTAEMQRRENLRSSRALRHREKLLRHALRVETIGDLAGMVCHQLRNTFQVLLGHVTMGEIADDVERARRLTMIEETLEQSRPLLDQLMSMAHPDEGRTETCDVGALVRQFEAQARLVLPGNIRLEAEVVPALPRVILNSRGLVHALWNLVINARQAIRGEGRIALRCGVSDGDVVVEIADTGCGMPEEVRQRIFDPYFTTKPPGQGTGLGLTAVDRFVRSSNGAVEVESQPGAGATFRLRFPAQPTAARSA